MKSDIDIGEVSWECPPEEGDRCLTGLAIDFAWDLYIESEA